MPTENRSSNTEAPFRREDRYLVIKYSDLDRLQGLDRHMFLTASRRAHEQMFAAGAHARQFLVIESDWPEFEPTWAAIEARMTGKPAEQHPDEPVAVLYASGDVLTKADCGDAFATCCKVETPLYTHPAPAVQKGEPVAWRYQTHAGGLWYLSSSEHNARMFENAEKGSCVEPLYTHPGAGEVERLRAEIQALRKTLPNSTTELVDLRAQLAERDALMREAITLCRTNDLHISANYFESKLSASAEPSATAYVHDGGNGQRGGPVHAEGYFCSGDGGGEVYTLVPSELSDDQIIEAMRENLNAADGGYVVDTAPDDVVKAGRALLARAYMAYHVWRWPR